MWSPSLCTGLRRDRPCPGLSGGLQMEPGVELSRVFLCEGRGAQPWCPSLLAACWRQTFRRLLREAQVTSEEGASFARVGGFPPGGLLLGFLSTERRKRTSWEAKEGILRKGLRKESGEHMDSAYRTVLLKVWSPGQQQQQQSSTWEPVRNANSRTIGSKSLTVGPAICVFRSPLGDSEAR